MSKTACFHVQYCDTCDRYYAECCGCYCSQYPDNKSPEQKPESKEQNLIDLDDHISEAISKLKPD